MKRVTSFIIILSIAITGFAQLTGIKTIPGSYPSIANAIAALNSSGVGAGGVTFNVAAGYTETFQNATAGLITTTTSSAERPIVFRKSGTGAKPVITGYTPAAGPSDYIICIAGTDYITFDGIDLIEQNGEVEWGYSILKASATDGSQHVTIKNCKITLERANASTIGICSMNVTPASPTTQLTITDPSGTNSNIKIFSDTILNCFNGIMFYGFADRTTYELYDQKNEIGKDGGNVIIDFGAYATTTTVPCNGIFTTFQGGQKIANNMVNGYAGGSGTCSGIKVDTANNTDLDLYNNTVSIVYDGTGSFYGIFDNHGNVYSGATVSNVYNNTVANCTYDNATNGTCFYMNINGGGATSNCYNNIVTNNTYGNGSTTASGTLDCIRFNGCFNMPGFVSYHHNQVTNITRVQLNVGSGTTYYMWVNGGGSQSEIHHNVINNNIVASSGPCNSLYILNNPTGPKNIYDNTVTNIFDANGDIEGLYTGNGGTTRVYRNTVQNLNSSGPSAKITGINLAATGTSYGDMYCYNNFVGDLKNIASSNKQAIFGINAYATWAPYLGLYNNTVYLNAQSTGADFGTAGIFLGESRSKVNELVNNIIVNTSIASGGGYTSILFYNDSLTNNYARISDNNNFYAGVPGPRNVMLYDRYHSWQTLADFQTKFYPGDSHSITELPVFVNTTTSPMDLHIDSTIPSVVESSGKIVSKIVTGTDIDNQPRFPDAGYPVNLSYPPIAPDMGADEFGGIPADRTGPSILYTPLLNTSSLVNRTFIATITDLNSVPTTGTGLPRLAWKKFYNGAWAYATGTSLGNSQYSFSFGGGVALNDSVYYFVVAQDNWTSPNAAAYPSVGASGFTVNPPAAAIPPVKPFKYKIVQGMCGTIMVGAGQPYPTLTAAINDLSDKEITCPVTLMLTDDLYESETYPIIINQLAGASEVNTLTIKPAPGKTPAFITSYQGVSPVYWSQITLNGAQYVIFDGSNSGGTDRSMTFQNTAANGFAAAIGFYNNGITPASYITVKNCVIRANPETPYNSQAITTQGIIGNAGFHDIIIDNNAVNTAKYGIQILGIGINTANNIQITNNTVGSTEFSKNIRESGIIVGFCNNVLIEGNEVIGSVEGRDVQFNYTGIYMWNGTKNARVRKNLIHDIHSLTMAAMGIFYVAEATLLSEISNNVIYSIQSPCQDMSTSGANTFGIHILTGGNINIYDNTVYLSGNYMSPTVEGLSSCLGFGNQITNVDVKNNILKNSSQPRSGSPSSKTYAVVAGNNNPGLTFDNNDYFVNGVGPNIGYFNGADRATLAAWQAATGQDVHTTNVDPVFTSATYLKPTTTSINHSGTYISTLPTDIAGVTRTNPPDVGAYEYSENPVVITGVSTAVSTSEATLNGSINAASYTVSSFFDYGLTNAYGNVISGVPALVTGVSATAITVPLTGLAPQTTYHFRARGVTAAGLIIFGNDQTFTTSAGVPINLPVATTISNDTCFNALQTITVAGLPNTFLITPTGHVTMIAGQSIRFLPGTLVQPGGYLHGHITLTNDFCSPTDIPVIAAQAEIPENPFISPGSFYRIYPNPSAGMFTLEFVSSEEPVPGNLEIYSMSGLKVLSADLTSEHKHEFSVALLKPGIYIVRIFSGGKSEMMKLVKL